MSDKKCEICGMPQKDDLFSYVMQEPVCSVCKLTLIGGLPTTPARIKDARDRMGLSDGQYLGQRRKKAEGDETNSLADDDKPLGESGIPF